MEVGTKFNVNVYFTISHCFIIHNTLGHAKKAFHSPQSLNETESFVFLLLFLGCTVLIRVIGFSKSINIRV